MFQMDQEKVERKISKIFVYLGWTVSFSFAIIHVYFRPYIKNNEIRGIYGSHSRVLWAAFVCWIIFACHQLKSGGIIRKFLSNVYWQRLSKLCLSIYLVHYVYINISEGFMIKTKDSYYFLWNVHISVGDVTISIVLGTLFYLLIEAPITNLLKLFWKNYDNCNRSRKSPKLSVLRIC